MENLDDDIWGDDGAREESEESVCDFIRSDSSYERQLLVEAVLTTPTHLLLIPDIATHLFVSLRVIQKGKVSEAKKSFRILMLDCRSNMLDTFGDTPMVRAC